ncbi:asparagine synthase C-terminal domain-containing protein [Campylobacter fetus subsp. fetus]|nr:asparagine synthase C-terminal domain-containing protein [Campylobacter fetus subsp. fetus]
MDRYYRIKDSFKTNKFMELYALEFRHFKNDEAKLLGISNEPNLSEFELENEYESMSFSDISTYLSDDIFVKTDRAAMSVSLEVREPLLSYKFVDFMIKADPNLRKNKALFKAYLLKHLPKELVMRPKMGFALPIEEWFHTDLGYLLDEYLTNQDFFDKQYILNLVQDFRDKKRVNFAKIWHILLFLMWKKRWNI